MSVSGLNSRCWSHWFKLQFWLILQELANSCRRSETLNSPFKHVIDTSVYVFARSLSKNASNFQTSSVAKWVLSDWVRVVSHHTLIFTFNGFLTNSWTAFTRLKHLIHHTSMWFTHQCFFLFAVYQKMQRLWAVECHKMSVSGLISGYWKHCYNIHPLLILTNSRTFFTRSKHSKYHASMWLTHQCLCVRLFWKNASFLRARVSQNDCYWIDIGLLVILIRILVSTDLNKLAKSFTRPAYSTHHTSMWLTHQCVCLLVVYGKMQRF